MFDSENENYSASAKADAAPLSMDSATSATGRIRTSAFKMRLTDEQLSDLQAEAEAYGVSAADYVRYQILGSNSCRRLPCQRELVGIESELARIGNNLNQAMRAVNEARKADVLTSGQFRELNSNLAAVRRLSKALKAQMSHALNPLN